MTKRTRLWGQGLVAQWLEHYPDKIGVVGSSPTEPTVERIFEGAGKWKSMNVKSAG